MIYADNAATTKMDSEVLDCMLPFLTEEYGNPSQPYSHSRTPKKALAQARADIAECIGAEPEEIFFTSGGTESDNWAVKIAVYDGVGITSAFEHHAVLHSFTAMERIGVPVAYIYPSMEGYILPETLAKVITGSTSLVSVMLVNNEIGTVQPVQELCKLAHTKGALFHTDAVQAAGHMKIDVRELGVDMLSASAHKFNGPRGIGFLYIKKGTHLGSLLDGGGQEHGMRAGTENVASIVGMATALKRNCEALDHNRSFISSLENRLLQRLSDLHVPYVRNGGSEALPGIISLSFDGQEGEMLLHRLDLMGICVSTGSACNSVKTEISHVLKAMSMDDSLARGTIRISIGKYNTADEVDTIATALKKILD